MRQDPVECETVRLNWKYVWKTAKRVCDFINTHEDIINISTFSEYRVVMLKVMGVIKEAQNVEKKRRQTTMKEKRDDATKMVQRAKALIAIVKQGEMSREEIERNVEVIFGKEVNKNLKGQRQWRALWRELWNCPKGKPSLNCGKR